MTLRSIALLVLFAGALALSPAAFAEGEEGGKDDLEARIKKKMEHILELMAKNESALLELSSGTAAKTRKVDVPVPEGEAGGAAAAGKKTAEELAKLARSQREDSGQIPDELKKLVEMIPL